MDSSCTEQIPVAAKMNNVLLELPRSCSVPSPQQSWGGLCCHLPLLLPTLSQESPSLHLPACSAGGKRQKQRQEGVRRPEERRLRGTAGREAAAGSTSPFLPLWRPGAARGAVAVPAAFCPLTAGAARLPQAPPGREKEPPPRRGQNFLAAVGFEPTPSK